MIRFTISILLLSAVQGQDKGRKSYESGKYDEARVYYAVSYTHLTLPTKA